MIDGPQLCGSACSQPAAVVRFVEKKLVPELLGGVEMACERRVLFEALCDKRLNSIAVGCVWGEGRREGGLTVLGPVSKFSGVPRIQRSPAS